MNSPEKEDRRVDADEWARRKSSNVRLGVIFGVIVLMIFLGSIWKYRPL